MEEMIGEIADFPATLEIATLADIPQLNELLTLLFTQEADFCPDPENQCAGLQRIIADPGVGHILTLKRDSKIFGMVNLLYTVSTALGETVAILEDMIVHPDYRGGGAGSLLLRGAIEFSRGKGCRRITLLTDHDNLGAICFYQRHGFTLSSMVPLRLAL
ncbi:MAG TPA: GNAT family N-acetyltransferase [Geobacteraceae bacterium]|nr:GNAT family N-acetyltransferase [Geobacteraceae bacterium]